MTVRDKLEIGLKPDAPYRKDNLPDTQKDDPACQDGGDPTEEPTVHRARNDCDDPSGKARPAGTRDRARRGPDPK